MQMTSRWFKKIKIKKIKTMMKKDSSKTWLCQMIIIIIIQRKDSFLKSLSSCGSSQFLWLLTTMKEISRNSLIFTRKRATDLLFLSGIKNLDCFWRIRLLITPRISLINWKILQLIIRHTTKIWDLCQTSVRTLNLLTLSNMIRLKVKLGAEDSTWVSG